MARQLSTCLHRPVVPRWTRTDGHLPGHPSADHARSGPVLRPRPRQQPHPSTQSPATPVLRPLRRSRRCSDPRQGRPIKPGKLHADKAYDRDDLRRWLRGKRIAVRIARKGIESGQRLGRHRWVIERTMSWLTGYRRLTIRYERYSGNYPALLGLAAALCCYKRLVRLTT
ncbi:transposase [Streptosporangium sp. LJ11]|uniref:transposase n=1 Tax=Streptosporangium sp. LJ11 TaxID=3436927 RepID=UPI003F797A1A